jgi:hypothetical protein
LRVTKVVLERNLVAGKSKWIENSMEINPSSKEKEI